MSALKRFAVLCAVMGALLTGVAVARADEAIVLKPPPSVDARVTAASAADALRMGNAVLAEQLASQALEAGTMDASGQARTLIVRGLAQQERGERAGAEDDYNAALSLNVLKGRDLAHAYFDRGVTRDELGRADDALADYEAAIKIQPRFAAALNNRANVFRRQGQFSRAEKDYVASLAAGNTSPQYAYFGLGQIEEASGNMAAARTWYEKAVEADSTYTLAAERLAALGAQGTYAEIVLKKPRGMDDAQAQDAPAQTASMPPLRPAIVDDSKRVSQRSSARERSVPRAVSASAAAVQLGAWRDQADAAAGWNRLQSRAGNLLDGLTPHIEAADIPGRGRYYRLRTGPLGSSEAANLCGALKARGLDCMAVGS